MNQHRGNLSYVVKPQLETDFCSHTFWPTGHPSMTPSRRGFEEVARSGGNCEVKGV